MTDETMDEAEARRILENLARNGPPTAQVASIKVLREMDKDAAEAEREAETIPRGWEDLYDDEVSKLLDRASNGRRAAAARPRARKRKSA